MARPITLKKDGIQTRNRKLAAAKAKKNKSKTEVDFLRFGSAYNTMNYQHYYGNAATQNHFQQFHHFPASSGFNFFSTATA